MSILNYLERSAHSKKIAAKSVIFSILNFFICKSRGISIDKLDYNSVFFKILAYFAEDNLQKSLVFSKAVENNDVKKVSQLCGIFGDEIEINACRFQVSGLASPALHLAISENHFELVEKLLELKAEIDAENEKNETGLDLAKKTNNAKIIDLLTKLKGSAQKIVEDIAKQSVKPEEEITFGLPPLNEKLEVSLIPSNSNIPSNTEEKDTNTPPIELNHREFINNQSNKPKENPVLTSSPSESKQKIAELFKKEEKPEENIDIIVREPAIDSTRPDHLESLNLQTATATFVQNEQPFVTPHLAQLKAEVNTAETQSKSETNIIKSDQEALQQRMNASRTIDETILEGNLEEIEKLIEFKLDENDSSEKRLSTFLFKALDLFLHNHLRENIYLAQKNNKNFRRDGDIGKTTEFLIEKCRNKNIKNEDGNTALHVIANYVSDKSSPEEMSKALAVTEILVKNGSNINAKNNHGDTALHIAALRKSSEFVEYIIKLAPDAIRETDAAGNNLLHIIASVGDLKLAQYLVDIDPNLAKIQNSQGLVPVIHAAPLYTDGQMINILLSKENNLRYKRETEQTCKVMAFHSAVTKRKKVLIDKMIQEFGSDIVNFKDSEGNTALHMLQYSCSRLSTYSYNKDAHTAYSKQDYDEYLAIQSELIRAGADTQARNNRNRTPSDMVAVSAFERLDRLQILNMNLKSSNYVKILDERGNTFLHLAAEQLDQIKIDLFLGMISQTVMNVDGLTYQDVMRRAAIAKGDETLFKTLLVETRARIVSSSGRSSRLRSSQIKIEKVKVDLNISDKQGKTLLHIAAAHGQANIIKLLETEEEINLEIKDNDGRSYVDIMFHLAIEKQDIDSIILLLDNPLVNLDYRDIEGRTLLHMAADVRSQTIINLLKSKIPESENSRLSILNNSLQTYDEIMSCHNINELFHSAVRAGNINAVKRLLSNQIMKFGKVNLDFQDNQGDTALHLAAKGNHLEIFKLLAKKQMVDLNIKNNSGNTILYEAISAQNLEMVAAWISQDANMNIKNKNGDTAFHIVAKYLSNESSLEDALKALMIAELLLEDGSNLNLGDDSDTLSHIAASRKYSEFIKYIFETAPDMIKNRNAEGNNLLHLAANAGNLELARFLVKHYPNLAKIKNTQGLIPAIYAAPSYTDAQMIEILLSGEKNLRYSKKVERICKTISFHLAIKRGQIDSIEKMIKCFGVSVVKFRDLEGNTALHILEHFCSKLSTYHYNIRASETYTENDYNNYIAIKNMLIKYHADTEARNNHNQTPSDMVAVSAFERFDKSQFMKMNIQFKHIMQILDERGNTFLHLVAEQLDQEKIEFFSQKISKTATNADGLTYRDVMRRAAIAKGDEKLFETLLMEIKTEGDIFEETGWFETFENDLEEIIKTLNIQDKQGKTLLHIAAAHGQTAIIKLLEAQEEIDPKIMDNAGRTYADIMLHLAIERQDVDSVTVLLSHPLANLEYRDVEGGTLLHMAAAHGQTATFKLLETQGGIDPKITDNAGRNYVDIMLHLAIEKQDLDSVTALLDHALVNLGYRDVENRTLLHMAAEVKNHPIINLLKSKNVDPDVFDNSFQTYKEVMSCSDITKLFHFAVRAGNINAVKRLLSTGITGFGKVNLDFQDIMGDTALHLAVRGGHPEILGLLAKEKISDLNVTNNFGNTILHEAVLAQNSDMIDLWVKSNIDSDVKINIDIINKNGDTALHIAMSQNNQQISQKLIKFGANFDIPDSQGRTASYIAVSTEHLETYETMINYGIINPNARNKQGCTILHLAVLAKKESLVKKILNLAIDLDISDNDGKTALHCAVSTSSSLTKILLEKLTKIDIVDSQGKTPLHYAVLIGRIKTVRFLLEKLPDVNSPDFEGRTPLHYAVSKRNSLIFKELIKPVLAVNKNAMDNHGNTALHYAILNGITEAATELISSKADLDLANDQGKTALHYAVLKNNSIIISTLILHYADINVPDSNGYTALCLAILDGNAELVREFLELPSKLESGLNKEHRAKLCVKVNLANMKGYEALRDHFPDKQIANLQKLEKIDMDSDFSIENNSFPLELAILTENFEICTMLVDHGANLHSINIHGHTPLDIANSLTNKDMFNFIRDSLNSKRMDIVTDVTAATKDKIQPPILPKSRGLPESFKG